MTSAGPYSSFAVFHFSPAYCGAFVKCVIFHPRDNKNHNDRNTGNKGQMDICSICHNTATAIQVNARRARFFLSSRPLAFITSGVLYLPSSPSTMSRTCFRNSLRAPFASLPFRLALLSVCLLAPRLPCRPTALMFFGSSCTASLYRVFCGCAICVFPAVSVCGPRLRFSCPQLLRPFYSAISPFSISVLVLPSTY